VDVDGVSYECGEVGFGGLWWGLGERGCDRVRMGMGMGGRRMGRGGGGGLVCVWMLFVCLLIRCRIGESRAESSTWNLGVMCRSSNGFLIDDDVAVITNSESFVVLLLTSNLML
jgi:hypothetical protein